MEIRKWTTVDVYYKNSEIDIAEKERKRLESLGYEYQQTDDGNKEYDFCDQYIKSGKTRKINH